MHSRARTFPSAPARLRAAVWIAALAVPAAFASGAAADQVLMKNGDRLSGTIVNKEPENVTLRTPYAGAIKLPWPEVAGIETESPARVLLEDGTDVTGVVTPAGDGAIEVRDAADGAVRRVPLAAVAYVNPTPEQSGEGWVSKGRVGLGLTDSSGNSDAQRLYGDADVTLRAKARRLNFGGRINRAEDAGTLTTSNWLARASYDRFVTEKLFWYGRTSFEHDRFKDLELRSAVGGGLGYQVFDGPRLSLSVQAGPDYVWLNRSDGDDERFVSAGWGLRAEYWIIDERLQAFHTQEGFIALSADGSTLVRTQTGLRAPIYAGLDANLQLNLDWESDPAPGRTSTDRTWIVGIGYGW